MAFDGANDFLLDSYDFDLSGTLTVSGIQQLIIDQDRGYFLADDSQFNWVRLRVGDNNAGVQSYFGAIGQKIPWEDWIRNLNADTAFVDLSQPNNGLNFKSSNYSMLNGYTIRAKGILNVSATDALGAKSTGDVIGYSDEITVSDYDLDKLADPAKWQLNIQLLDPDTLVDIGEQILSDRPTLMRCTHVYIDGPPR